MEQRRCWGDFTAGAAPLSLFAPHSTAKLRLLIQDEWHHRQDAPLSNLLTACENCFSNSDNPTLVRFPSRFGTLLVHSVAHFRSRQITAHLSLLSLVLRNAPPSALLPHWSALYHLLAFLPENVSSGKSGAKMAKMRCKVAGRLALLRLGRGGARERGGVDAAGEEEEVLEEVEVIVGELIEGLGHPVRLASPLSA